MWRSSGTLGVGAGQLVLNLHTVLTIADQGAATLVGRVSTFYRRPVDRLVGSTISRSFFRQTQQRLATDLWSLIELIARQERISPQLFRIKRGGV